MKLGWLQLSLGLAAGVLAAGAAVAAEALPEVAPPERLLAACAESAATTLTAGKGRLKDLEVFVLAEARESRGETQAAAQARQYLKEFFPNSPLIAKLPEVPEHTSVPELWDTDPEWARLVREGVRLAQQNAAPDLWRDWYALTVAASRHPAEMLDAPDLADFLSRRPDAPLAGWAAYQLLWERRLLQIPETETEGFQAFWAAHPQHPLASEASEALDVPWFSPGRLAHLSLLLPGWGEELLEPGLRESSRPLLSETIYLLGTLGFLAAAQHQSRQGNLTGALIFINLLMQNHLGSAEQAFATAVKRNASERRKFITERADQPMAGSGRFSAPDFSQWETGRGLQQATLAVGYCGQSAASAWRGTGAVHEDQLDNLKLSLAWGRTLLAAEVFSGWHLGLALTPKVQWFSTRADARAEAAPAYEVQATEWGGALQATGLLRWEGEGPWIQLRLSAGPGYRQRRASGGGAAFNEQGSAWFGAAALQAGGESGVFWEAGVSADDSFRDQTITLPDRVASVPSRSQEIHFGLGVYY